MNIDQLIEEASKLKNTDYSSPRIEMWKKRTKEFVKLHYDPEYVNILEDALSWGRVIVPGEGPSMHLEAMNRAIEFLDNLKHEPKISNNKIDSSENGEFLDKNTLLELKSIKSEKFDTKKLLKFCEELNDSYSRENYLSCTLLIRAVLNHIPPIFGHTSFSQVVAHSGKSIKKVLSQLGQSSRPIADLHTHILIRKKEQLPSKHQIEPYKPSFEILIQEIINTLSID
ncbi:MAG: hypothetical protein ABFQ62_05140 [Patescibacteria group bacterium]